MWQRRRLARDGHDDPTPAERAAPLIITEETGLGSLAASRHAALLEDDNARAAHSAGGGARGGRPQAHLPGGRPRRRSPRPTHRPGGAPSSHRGRLRVRLARVRRSPARPHQPDGLAARRRQPRGRRPRATRRNARAFGQPVADSASKTGFRLEAREGLKALAPRQREALTLRVSGHSHAESAPGWACPRERSSVSWDALDRPYGAQRIELRGGCARRRLDPLPRRLLTARSGAVLRIRGS